MLINLRNALMAGKRLPYDAEVEYLESTGTQWIDTGIVVNSLTSPRLIVGIYVGNVGSNTYPVGGDGAGTNERFSVGVLTNRRLELRIGTYSNFTVEEGWYTVELDGSNGKCYVDDVLTYTSSTYANLRNNTSRIYFGRIRGDATLRPGKISFLQIFDGNVLVRDYIPVRKGTVGYLYDRVSGKLFGNAGTGDFVLGPDVVPVEYIESHGTEYINTGYIPNQQTRWELDYQFTSIGTALNGMFQENPTIRFNIGREANGFFNISYGANNALNIASDTLRHLFVADIPNLQWRLDSYSGAFPAPVSTTLQYSLRIFCRNSPGGIVYNLHSGKCFASRMYQSDALSQRLLPVRVGTEGAMMDVLTRRIYRNAGTGAFTFGNDLKYPIPAE